MGLSAATDAVTLDPSKNLAKGAVFRRALGRIAWGFPGDSLGNLARCGTLVWVPQKEPGMSQRNRITTAVFVSVTAAVLTLALPVEAQVPASAPSTAPAMKPADTVNLTMEQKHVIKEIILKDLKVAEPADQQLVRLHPLAEDDDLRAGLLERRSSTRATISSALMPKSVSPSSR